MRQLTLAAAVMVAALFSNAATAQTSCLSVDDARSKVVEAGGVVLGLTGGPVVEIDGIMGPEVLASAADVLIFIRQGAVWWIPVDAAGCTSPMGFTIEPSPTLAI